MARGSAVVVGNFDGVHQGHQAVLRAAGGRAGRQVVAVTFWPHPIRVLAPHKAPGLLCGLRERVDLLRRAGASEVRVVRFSRELAEWSPAQFVDRIIDPIAPELVVVGDNFRFGAKAAGDVNDLREIGRGRFEALSLSLAEVESVATSSTLIRSALAQGDVSRAGEHLGRLYRRTGLVVLGDQRGRGLGFPTANLLASTWLASPADGVYAGYVQAPELGAERMPAAVSVGSNPTFDGDETRVEAHVIGHDDLRLYGREIHVDFVARLRGQKRFSSTDALVSQMGADVEAALGVLAP